MASARSTLIKLLDFLNKSESPYGKDGILDENDIQWEKVFALHKQTEYLKEKFEEHNLNHYTQGLEASDFINTFWRAIGKPKLYKESENPHCKIKQFCYIKGIPVLVVDRLPWDNPEDAFRTLGNFYSVGILAVEEKTVISTIRHEMVHAVNYFFRKEDVYKVAPTYSKETSSFSGLFFQHVYYDAILDATRDEIIAYSLDSPGKIAKMDRATQFQFLSLNSEEKLKTKITKSEFENIETLHKLAVLVDSGKAKIGRIKFCQILLDNHCFQGINNAILLAIKDK
jgi:hypothetical protein